MSSEAAERAVAANAHSGDRVHVPMAFVHRYQGAKSADTFADRLERCYELALRAHQTFAMHGWRTTLVHGVIGPAHNPHAWIEWRDDSGKRYAWDPVLDGIIPGRTYVADYYAITWDRYGPRESARLAERSNGPWGVRNCKRAIERINRMMASGTDPEAGRARIQQIIDDNHIKEIHHA